MKKVCYCGKEAQVEVRVGKERRYYCCLEHMVIATKKELNTPTNTVG